MATVSFYPPTADEHESSGRIVWALAWPAVALNSLQVLNTLLDRSFIGRLPQEALTAHGGASTVMFLMFSFAMVFGSSATALVSRAFGARKLFEMRTASHQSQGVSLIAGLLSAAVCIFCARLFALGIFAKDPLALEAMTQFLVAYGFGLPAIFLIQSLAGSLRGIGDTKSPMVISGIQILLHIVLNFLFIFPTRTTSFGLVLPGAGWGLTGAAIALSSSAWVAALIYLFHSMRTPLGGSVRIELPRMFWVQRILRIALPAGLMSFLRVASFAVVTLMMSRLPATEGSVAIAAMSIGFAIESVMFMPAFGLSVAAAALVGQSLGMKRPDRAEKLGWAAGHHAALVTALLSAAIFIFADPIVAVMTPNKPLIAMQAAWLIRCLCVTEIAFAYSMAMIGAMQGAGDTVRPMWITLVAMWALRVPLTYILVFPAGMGATGAWIAMSSTQAIQGILAIWMWKQGAWKTVRL